MHVSSCESALNNNIAIEETTDSMGNRDVCFIKVKLQLSWKMAKKIQAESIKKGAATESLH